MIQRVIPVALEALIEQIRALDPSDARRIERTHRSVRGQADMSFRDAWTSLGRDVRWDAWLSVQRAIWDAIEAGGFGQRVRYAAYDAALAIIARDAITPTDFARLYGPWASGRDEHVLSVEQARA